MEAVTEPENGKNEQKETGDVVNFSNEEAEVGFKDLFERSLAYVKNGTEVWGKVNVHIHTTNK